MEYMIPRIVLAGTNSGCGKTTVACAILQALVNRELNVGAFKCGPDYIDPMFHTKVLGMPSRNLDPFFTDRKTTRMLFARSAEHAGISVMEGVMGVYDGLGGITKEASSYDLAKKTDTPIILSFFSSQNDGRALRGSSVIFFIFPETFPRRRVYDK